MGGTLKQSEIWQVLRNWPLFSLTQLDFDYLTSTSRETKTIRRSLAKSLGKSHSETEWVMRLQIVIRQNVKQVIFLEPFSIIPTLLQSQYLVSYESPTHSTSRSTLLRFHVAQSLRVKESRSTFCVMHYRRSQYNLRFGFLYDTGVPCFQSP